MNCKKLLALGLTVSSLLTAFVGCTANAQSTAPATEDTADKTDTAVVETVTDTAVTAPKYVFLFVGDGMSYP